MSDQEQPDTARPVDPERVTVHEAMSRISGAADVFARFGLDTCCGGDLPVATAARHHDVDLGRLLDGLEAAARDADGSGSAVPEGSAG